MNKYHALLCRIAQFRTRNDFDEILKGVMTKADISLQKLFSFKMEIARLSRDCKRVIDLRGCVDASCYPYERDSITHYLDDLAVSVFESQYSLFGKYTLGVYESATNTSNNFRVMHKKNKDLFKKHGTNDKFEQESNLIDMLNFSKLIVRKEERMHYVSDVMKVGADGDEFLGHTIDISVSGIKIKLEKGLALKVNNEINLRLSKLESEYALELSHGLKYKIVSSELSGGYNIIQLVRIQQEETKKFDAFLLNYINGNKRRYKINLENTINSVINRGYSQYSLPRREDLPILVRTNDCKAVPFMAVSTELNRPLHDFWLTENSTISVDSLFTPERIKYLEVKAKDGYFETYAYVFYGIGKKGNKIFYGGLLEDFKGNSGLLSSFCNLGASKYNFKVFKISLAKSGVEQAHQPFSLNNENINIFKKLNKKPSARVINKLSGLTSIIFMTEITSSSNINEYRNADYNENDLQIIKGFKLPISGEKILVSPVKFIDKRLEDRYEYSTFVTLKDNKITTKCQTIDLSTKGVKLKLSERLEINEGDTVKLTFPEFIAEFKDPKLTDLRYKVIKVNNEGDEISLIINGDKKEHYGRIFIKELIKSKSNFLFDLHSGIQDIELSSCIQNLISVVNVNISLYVKRKGKRIIPLKGSVGILDNQASKLFTQASMFDSSILTNKLIYRELCEESFSQMHSNQTGQNFVYIRKSDDESMIKLESQFSSIEEKIKFIKESSKKDEFYCFKVVTAKAARPDLSKISSELSYISVYAIHKGKEIEEELWSVCGILTATDVTEETLRRLNVQ